MLKAPRFWYQRSISFFSILLLPASLLWFLGSFLKKKLSKVKKFDLPIVAVGSAMIGGSGKTPSVLFLCEQLKNMGYKPHIISKGYGGSASETIKVSEDMDYNLVGDEALMMAKYYPTWISKNKINAFPLAKKDGADILVLDDALQTYSVYKNLSVYVYDSIQAFGNKLLIPSGPLRETLKEVIKKSQIFFLINTDHCEELKDIPNQIKLKYQIEISNDLIEKKLFAFAGLGFNKKFFDQLKSENLNIIAVKEFPDHHKYSVDDIFKLLDEANKNDSYLVTTEKDHMRIPREFKSSVGIIYGKIILNDDLNIADTIEKYF